MRKLSTEQQILAINFLSTRAEYPRYLLHQNNFNKNYTKIQECNPTTLKLSESALEYLIVQATYLISTAYHVQIPLLVECKREYISLKEYETQAECALYISYRFPQTDLKEKPQLDTMVANVIDHVIGVYNRQNSLKPQQVKEQSSEESVNHGQTLLSRFIKQYQNLKNSQAISSTAVLLRCLEYTELFRKTSVLLRLQNMSMISFIRSNPEVSNELQEKVDRERTLMSEHKVGKLLGTNQQKLQDIQIKLEQNIRGFFTDNMNDMLTVEDFENSQNTETFQLNFIAKTEEKEFSYVQKVEQILNKAFDEEQADQPQNQYQQHDFMVQYSSKRYDMIVQTYTDIYLSVETSDYLSIQTKQIAYDSGHIMLDVCEKPSSEKKNARCLSFKVHSCFSKMEPIVTKSILALDSLLVAKLVLEPIFQTDKFVSGPKAIELNRVLNHYQTVLNHMFDNLLPEKTSS